MEDVILVEDQYDILATSSLADDRMRVLKHGETFAVFDRYGDIQPLGLGEQGLYHEGTRFLSRQMLRLGRDRPLLLSSTVKGDNALLAVDLTNPDLTMNGHVVVPRGTLHIFRAKFLWQGVGYERLRIYNYGLMAVDVPLALQLDADFADIFEVRGLRRKRRGYKLEAIVKHDGIMLGYAGLDGVTRRTSLQCSPPPVEASGSELRLEIKLPPKGEATFELAISCESAGPVRSRVAFDHALLAAADALKQAKSQDCEIYTSMVSFNRRHTGRSLLRATIGLTPFQGLEEFRFREDNEALERVDEDLVVFEADIHLRRSAQVLLPRFS